MTAERFPELARFLAEAWRADPASWPAEARGFAARHGAATARELLRFLSLFAGLPRSLRALDLAAEHLAAHGRPDDRGQAPHPDSASGRERFAAVYGADAAPVLERLAQLDPHLRDWVLEHAYGRGYAGAELTLEERERLAVLALARTGCWKQCESHLRACARLGVPAATLRRDAECEGWLTAEQAERLRARVAEREG